MTKTTSLTLIGTTDYNTSYPPADAKKGYVARITGQKYEREFLRSEVDLVEGDEGLYERQRGDRKGGYTRWYHVVLSHSEHGLIKSSDCGEDVPRIAKLLDDGLAIEDIVEVCDLRPHAKVEGQMTFDVRVRTTAEARKVKKSATVGSAIAACWDVLDLLPLAEQKNVLAALRKRATPPSE